MDRPTPKRSQTLRFPRLGIKIEVDRDRDEATLIDVVVPDQFFAAEFSKERWFGVEQNTLSDDDASKRRHAICNRLHVASLAIEILQNRGHGGGGSEIEQTLEIAVESLTALEHFASEPRTST